MKEHIHWQKLKGDTVNGNGIQVIYTFTSFDAEEINKIEKWCRESIEDGIIVDGLRADDLSVYKEEVNVTKGSST